MFEGEVAGNCKTWFYNRGAPEICGLETRRREYHYCYDCYHTLKDAFGEPEFPPAFDGVESRYGIGESQIFIYNPNQLDRLPKVQLATRYEGIGKVNISPKWENGDKTHKGKWTTYVLRLSDDSLYVGQTRKTAKDRYEEHQSGTGAKTTKMVPPRRLVYHVQSESRELAMQTEKLLFEAYRRAGLRVTKGDEDAR